MDFDPSSLGLPVEVDQISRQLKKLWDTDSETKTRAGLLNFAVYCRGTDELASNTELISRFVRDRACRALLVGVCPSRPGPKISAWIQAHCHLTKAGAKEVCSEQITLLAEGMSESGVTNVLMANLDYDLPLTLWWQGEFPENVDSPLWPWVDRLIFDSQSWINPAEQLHRLHNIKAASNGRMAFGDLNWTRTLGIRRAVAESFDSHILAPQIQSLDTLEIRHAQGSRSAAYLLACWFATQLGWRVSEHGENFIRFQNSKGEDVNCTFATAIAEGICGLTVGNAQVSLSVSAQKDASLFTAKICDTEETLAELHFPAGPKNTIDLLLEEMSPSVRHRVYQKVLAIAQVLF